MKKLMGVLVSWKKIPSWYIFRERKMQPAALAAVFITFFLRAGWREGK